MNYKILFIGIGSIAKRHIRNLTDLLNKRNILFEIDILRSGIGRALPEDIKALIHRQYVDSKDLPDDYEMIFITNPTSLHFETIQQYSKITRNMFIEKPLFDSLKYNIKDLELKNDGIYYVACPLRYTSVLQYVKNHIDSKEVIAVRSISSSYLPNWRPGTDYRETYSAHKQLGGGVSIDLIHEWDYLSWLFGMPDEVQSIIGKYSKLDIDSDDSALYIGSNCQMTFELHLDYYGRSSLRKMQIFMQDDTIEADIINSRVTYLGTMKQIDLKEERDAYQMRELEHFLDIIYGKCENDNNIEHAMRILQLAQGKV